MQNSEIGRRIKERRQELGLTQMQLAEKAHISTSQVCYLESGKRNSSAITINTLSEVLNCSAEWLLKGITSKSPQNNSPKEVSGIKDDPNIKELSTTEGKTDEKKLGNIKNMLDMYLYIDTVDQEEILLLLELKYKKKEKERIALISELLKNPTDSSTL